VFTNKRFNEEAGESNKGTEKIPVPLLCSNGTARMPEDA
jgi:hypothetical protein